MNNGRFVFNCRYVSLVVFFTYLCLYLFAFLFVFVDGVKILIYTLLVCTRLYVQIVFNYPFRKL